MNPSTYWIDRTLSSLAHGEERIASGNAWDLLLEDGYVVARSQYDVADPQQIAVNDFVDALDRWRQEVVRVLAGD